MEKGSTERGGAQTHGRGRRGADADVRHAGHGVSCEAWAGGDDGAA